MPEIKSLQDKDLDENSLKVMDKMVVLFESPWCHGCKAAYNMIQELSDEKAHGCLWGKVDISIQQELAERFGVISLPTVLVFHKGEVVKRFSGRISKEKLLEAVS